MADDERRNMNLEDEVTLFINQCAELASLPCDQSSAPKFRALQAEEVKLRKRLDATRVEEKAPHLEAERAVDAKYQPLIASIKDAVKAVTRALTEHLEAEEAKARAAAAEARRKAQEEAERAAALAREAEVEDDPFEAFDKVEESRKVEAGAASLARQGAEPVKVNVTGSEGGRAAGLRTMGWIPQITDQAAFAAHYAEYEEVLELMKTIAKREAKASKGRIKVPGCTFVEDRRAA